VRETKFIKIKANPKNRIAGDDCLAITSEQGNIAKIKNLPNRSKLMFL